jgi:hypothetical protein
MVQTKEEKRDKYLQRKYGITSAQYDLLLVSHDGGCWICTRKPTGRSLHVEHDHKTGRVRGVTCWPCNKLLREARDNPDILARAAVYLVNTDADTILGRE